MIIFSTYKKLINLQKKYGEFLNFNHDSLHLLHIHFNAQLRFIGNGQLDKTGDKRIFQDRVVDKLRAVQRRRQFILKSAE